jgi:hypothetical protein
VAGGPSEEARPPVTKNKEGKKKKKKRANQQLFPGDDGNFLVFYSDWKVNPKYL